MLVAEIHLGHRDDPALAERLAAAEPYRVALSDVERRRSRVRTETESGADLGVVVGRDLDDGDVLETRDGDLVVVGLESVEALVVDLADAEVAATAALELGHALGNRHWSLAVRGNEALVPVTDSVERMTAFVEDLLPPGATTRRESVPPTTFDDAGPDHGHAHGDGEHDHGDGEHDHGDGEHDHGRDHAHDDHGRDHAHDDHGHSHGHGHDRGHDHDGSDCGHDGNDRDDDPNHAPDGPRRVHGRLVGRDES